MDHHMSDESRPSRRQARRMSDSGFVAAYDGIKHAVGPLVSPRQNARRVTNIFKGLGHGIGSALRPSSPKAEKAKVDLGNDKLTRESMRALVNILGISDAQIMDLQRNGLTIANLELTIGLGVSEDDH
jgi:hypothetical protein